MEVQLFPFLTPLHNTLNKQNRDRANTSQATAGITVVFCEVLWELSQAHCESASDGPLGKEAEGTWQWKVSCP